MCVYACVVCVSTHFCMCVCVSGYLYVFVSWCLGVLVSRCVKYLPQIFAAKLLVSPREKLNFWTKRCQVFC